MNPLTQYEKDRIKYLEYYEVYPENKGGLDDNERVELFRLREKSSLDPNKEV